MEFHISVMILPLRNTPASNVHEAREWGQLKVDCVKLAKEFEVKIREAVEARHG